MTIECNEALYEFYKQEDNEIKNFYLNSVTKKLPEKLKQQNILLSLSDSISSTRDICLKNYDIQKRKS